MRAILAGAAAAVLMASAGGFAAGPDETLDAKLLVGKWVPKDKEGGKDFTVEFGKGGKVSYHAGAEVKIEGTYKLDGNKLSLTMKLGDTEKTRVRTVSRLTKTELVSRDDTGKEDTLVRVADKK